MYHDKQIHNILYNITSKAILSYSKALSKLFLYIYTRPKLV